jgi:hypothetical protein
VDATAPPNEGDTDAGPAEEPTCNPIDKLDLLLMIDNSNSMAGEQASLKRTLPGLIEALTSGKREASDPAPFPGVTDLHIGVVSSDMGIPGVELPPSCYSDGGDDGRLLNGSSGENCDASYPQWLTFDAAAPNRAEAVTKLGNDLNCISSLGTGGCGFEQQLESPFKALMLKPPAGAQGPLPFDPYRFISVTEEGTWGRGNVPAAQGGNLGFVRPSSDASPSLVVVIVVTDEDDCSVKSTDHLKPNNQLPEDSPYRQQDINLRCHLNKGPLYDIKARYYDGLRSLRPGREDLVMFAAIAGVPSDLVSAEAMTQVDFESTDSASRQTFYDTILSDARMQDAIDPQSMPGSGQGNVTPSCVRAASGETMPSTAYPPRRIVELSKLFDKNSMIQSICQDDFSVPSRAIIDMIARKLQNPCTR